MTWLTPMTGLLLGLALIPPLILLYFLKLRRHTQTVACTLLWKRSVEDLQANTPFQRLRRNILLLLQLLALGLLIASVMQPQVMADRPSGARTVFLIDNSASMTATDIAGGRTRLDEAKRLAKERIEQLHGGGLFTGTPGETMIVAFSDRAEVTAPFTNSRQQLLAAIDRIQPTHGETRLDEALRLARAYTTNVVDEMGEARPIGEPAHLELFSDGRIADAAQQVLRGETITYHAVGMPNADNVAVASMAVERPFDRPTMVEVFASLLNFNEFEVTCDVQLSVGGAAVGIRDVRVGPATRDPSTDDLIPTRNNVVFAAFELPRGAVIEVANLRQDDMMADNVAQVIVPPPKRLRVALVSSPRNYLTRAALEGMALERLEMLSGDRFDLLAEEGRLDVYDVIVLDNHSPRVESLPAGRYLTFGATPPVEGLHEYGSGERDLVLTMREEHPVLRYVQLANLITLRSRLIQPGDDVEVLVEGSRGPLMLAVSRGPLHLIHVAFDPLDSTWPTQRSWVTFIFNAVEYLGHVGEGITAKGLRPGEAIATRLPAGASDVQIATPEGIVDRLSLSDPLQFTWGPTRLAGVHLLNWREPGVGERQSRAFAVNLFSDSEGHIAVNPELELALERVRGQLADGSRYMPLWPWALALCLALLMLEWWVYHRKMYS
jgi:hypothetical protein